MTATKWVSLMSAALVLLMCRVSLAIDPLEGSKWKVIAQPDDPLGKAKSFEDMIDFKAGKFWVEGFEARGFKKAEYDQDTRGMTTAAFDATIESASEGKMKWHGSVTATGMTGDITWTKKDGSTVTYSFTAEKQPK
jgi:hypothetical protein